jgi:hypothetical protein
MGVNIDLDISDWDQFLNSGMKRIHRDDDTFPKVQKPLNLYDEYTSNSGDFRPANFDLWRNELSKMFIDSRVYLTMWLNGLSEMEKDESLWFSVSY